MKISARFDGSIYGAIRSQRQVSRAVLAAAAAATTEYATVKLQFGLKPAASALTGGAGIRASRPKPGAGAPRFHAQLSRSPYSTIASRGGRRPLYPSCFASGPPCQRNWNHTSSVPAKLPSFSGLPASRGRSRKQLLRFVDHYDGVTVEEQLELLRDPYMRRYARPNVPELVVSDQPHHMAAPLPDEVQRSTPEDRAIVARLRTTVFSRLLRPYSAYDNDNIYDLYRALPEPRVTFLSASLRHAFLAVLGATERKNPKAMLRYFAVVADIKKAGLSLTSVEWNTAMSFASRYVGKSSEAEAEAALHIWREMEHDAGIHGDEVTFNILFDVASKSGKFALAEMVYQEMITRGYQFNRYHHVSLIHYFGLKMDASGVRAAYKEMVDHGEIIDTVVLNCVISSFLRCGDEAAAEHVYSKMKDVDGRSKLIPHRNYTFNKMVSKVLMMFARVAKTRPEMRRVLQSTGMVSPDLVTYRILLNHYGVRLGQMGKVAQFLDEMKWFRVPVHGAIFLALFKGFARHGGGGNASDWSTNRLESIWEAFLSAYDGGADGLYISTWMAMWILRAFAKCTRSRTRVLAVYDDLKQRWEPDSHNDTFMLDFLHKLLVKNGLSVK
ncbi:uncharacterized protein JN550_003056 [Neoarthrinium moseri]|uniref:uncharacterized protein n=1 Tax=Neoarthrinium moseri TaxID=1658444 RepID=UPI001FDBD051|nr:uncharacterized protein JN550_003056 [Neoarthrinium moseri]KAI1873787.1 hypothetical protein JN550_003056 [Neoarthrinium moseri]